MQIHYIYNWISGVYYDAATGRARI